MAFASVEFYTSNYAIIYYTDNSTTIAKYSFYEDKYITLTAEGLTILISINDAGYAYFCIPDGDVTFTVTNGTMYFYLCEEASISKIRSMASSAVLIFT